MNDSAHFLTIVFLGIVFIIINIWRASTKRRLSDEEKQRDKHRQTDIKEDLDDDTVTNPEFSFLKFNIFHKDQKDDDD